MRCIGAVKSRSAGAMSRMANSGSRVRRPSNYKPEGPENSYLAPRRRDITPYRCRRTCHTSVKTGKNALCGQHIATQWNVSPNIRWYGNRQNHRNRHFSTMNKHSSQSQEFPSYHTSPKNAEIGLVWHTDPSEQPLEKQKRRVQWTLRNQKQADGRAISARDGRQNGNAVRRCWTAEPPNGQSSGLSVGEGSGRAISARGGRQNGNAVRRCCSDDAAWHATCTSPHG